MFTSLSYAIVYLILKSFYILHSNFNGSGYIFVYIVNMQFLFSIWNFTRHFIPSIILMTDPILASLIMKGFSYDLRSFFLSISSSERGSLTKGYPSNKVALWNSNSFCLLMLTCFLSIVICMSFIFHASFPFSVTFAAVSDLPLMSP